MARGHGLRKAFAEKFDDELKFFKGWIDKPKTVGSIVPTSAVTARKMASIVNPRSGLPVLEVAPGTGVLTRAILAEGVKPENLYAVEYSTDFVRHLRRLYPGVNVIEGDAFNLDATLGGPRDRATDLWSPIADPGRTRRLHGRAFRLHLPQHSADAALDLPAQGALEHDPEKWEPVSEK